MIFDDLLMSGFAFIRETRGVESGQVQHPDSGCSEGEESTDDENRVSATPIQQPSAHDASSAKQPELLDDESLDTRRSSQENQGPGQNDSLDLADEETEVKQRVNNRVNFATNDNQQQHRESGRCASTQSVPNRIFQSPPHSVPSSTFQTSGHSAPQSNVPNPPRQNYQSTSGGYFNNIPQSAMSPDAQWFLNRNEQKRKRREMQDDFFFGMARGMQGGMSSGFVLGGHGGDAFGTGSNVVRAGDGGMAMGRPGQFVRGGDGGSAMSTNSQHNPPGTYGNVTQGGHGGDAFGSNTGIYYGNGATGVGARGGDGGDAMGPNARAGDGGDAMSGTKMSRGADGANAFMNNF